MGNIAIISIYAMITLIVLTFESHRETTERKEFSNFKLKNEVNIFYADENQGEYTTMLL
jgi:hypothetical protein